MSFGNSYLIMLIQYFLLSFIDSRSYIFLLSFVDSYFNNVDSISSIFLLSFVDSYPNDIRSISKVIPAFIKYSYFFI